VIAGFALAVDLERHPLLVSANPSKFIAEAGTVAGESFVAFGEDIKPRRARLKGQDLRSRRRSTSSSRPSSTQPSSPPALPGRPWSRRSNTPATSSPEHRRASRLCRPSVRTSCELGRDHARAKPRRLLARRV
jgi:hypothetical protein